jgi:primosomal protein N''
MIMNSDKKLVVVYHGQVMLEFDRGVAVPGKQRQYLDEMDQRMDQGISLGEGEIIQPNPLQRAQFVANSMVSALIEENNNQAIAMCTYLAKRIPDLEQVKAISKDDGALSIELVFDRSFEKAQQEQTVEVSDSKLN